MFQHIIDSHQNRKSQKGFTLIELLLVIVILGVLSGIVVFAVGGITDRGDTAACKADKKTVEIAQEAYFAKRNPGDYADTVQDLVDDGLLRAPAPAGVSTSDSGVVTTTRGC